MTPIPSTTPIVKDIEFISGNTMGLNNILSISEAGKVGFYDKSTGIFSLLSNLNKSINAAPAIGNFVLISDSEGTLHCWLGPTPDYSPTRTFEGTYSPTPTITATMTSTELVSYTPTPTGTNGPTTIRINCGGSGYTDTDGNLWQEDVQYSAGAWGYTGYSNQASTETGIGGTNNPAIYQDFRWGNSFGYKFDIPNGIYKITFKFAETQFNEKGRRNFKITVNNAIMLQDFDICSIIAEYQAVDWLYEIEVSAGQLEINFNGVTRTDNAILSGIKIEKIYVFSTQTPTSTSTISPTFTITQTCTPTSTITITFTVSPTPTITNTEPVLNIAWPQQGCDSANTGYSPLAGSSNALGERYRLIAPYPPESLVADNSKNIYFTTDNAQGTNNLYKIADDGSFQYIVDEDVGVSGGLALGLFNHLYYPEFNIDGTEPFAGLHAMDIADGTVNWSQHIPIYDWNYSRQFITSGLRIDKKGQIYFSISGGGVEKIVDNNTSALNAWDGTSAAYSIGGGGCYGSSAPTVIDSNGYIYTLVSVSENCPQSTTGIKIVKYSPSAEFIKELILDAQDIVISGLLLDEDRGLIYVKKRDISNANEDIYLVIDSDLNGVLDTIRTGILNNSGPMGVLYKQTGELFFVGNIDKAKLDTVSTSWYAGHESNNRHGLFSYKYDSATTNKVTLRYFTGYYGSGTTADNIADINTNIVVDSYGKIYFGTDKEFYIIQKGNMVPVSRNFETGTKGNLVIGADNRVYYSVNNTIVCLAPGGAIQPPSGGVPPKPIVITKTIKIWFIKITIKITVPCVGCRTNYYLSGSPYTKLNDEPVEGDTFEFDSTNLIPGKEYSIIYTTVDALDQESEPSDPITFIFGTPTATETQIDTITETITPTFTETIKDTDTCTPTITETETNTITLTATLTKTPTITETITETSTPTYAIELLFKSGDINSGTNSPHPMFRLKNMDARQIDLSNIEIRYWYRFEGLNQSEVPIIDYAGKLPAGLNIQDSVTSKIINGNFEDGQNRYLNVTFSAGAGTLDTGNYVDINTRFNKTDWSAYDQSNDWSYIDLGNYLDWQKVTVYYSGILIWGIEPQPYTPAPTFTVADTITESPEFTQTIFLTATPTETLTEMEATTLSLTRTYTLTPIMSLTATTTPVQSQLSANVTLKFSVTDTNDSTNYPHPQFRIYNNDSSPLELSRVEIRYWYKFEGTSQTEQAAIDYAGRFPSGTNIEAITHSAIITGSFGTQDRYLRITFDAGAGSLLQNEYTEIQARFNKSDWSFYTQSNDYSYTNYTSFTDWYDAGVYVDGILVWGTSPGAGISSVSKINTDPQAIEPLSDKSVYNYPNPFSGETTIRFSVDSISDVRIAIYDTNDRPVWSKAIGAAAIHKGVNIIKWDTSNDDGMKAANGVYLLVIKAGNKKVIKKIVVVR